MKSLFALGWKCPASAVRVARRYRSGPRKQGHSHPDKLEASLATSYHTQLVRKQSHKQSYDVFKDLVDHHLRMVLDEMGQWHADHLEFRSFMISSQSMLVRESNMFRAAIHKAFALASVEGKTARDVNPLFWNLRNAFVKADTKGLSRELKYAFQAFLLRSRFPKAATDFHRQVADMRFPFAWFPATRVMQRTVHLHVGPTNSGKTYHALKSLEQAKTGVYAGPLRLLAHEVYSRFQAKGKPCALITGEEIRIPDDADTYITSCTVEMAPINQRVDVAVIDEIQMIGDDSRGWAWTQAFLGIQAKELHLCGEDRAVDLIQDLCERIGDKCIVHRYQRLSPLRMMKESLGGFGQLRKGDAVIAFSRVNLHSLKSAIEQATQRRCAIVYGSLPPETRAQQAALFNDPNNDYDFLVASDAIGMGLNLEVKRIVFETASKFDGQSHRFLAIPEVKQIAGRAGRYRTATQEMASAQKEAENVAAGPVSTATAAPPRWGTPGFVTTLEQLDHEHISDTFERDAPPIESAGIIPPPFILERFYSLFPPHTPLSFILARLRENSRLSDRFFMCNLAEMLQAAELIEDYPMSITDRCTLLAAPLDSRDQQMRKLIKAMARCISQSTSGHILDIHEMDLEVLEVDEDDPEAHRSRYLMRLESLHKSLSLYLWLSYRYKGIFSSQRLAFHIKELTEARVGTYLSNLNFTDEARSRRVQRARARAEQHRHREEELLGAENEAPAHNDGQAVVA
ncbi:P-loop containing nucleoside triphosphate hydrolase protein [Apodospora peruviana]|uniref:RNA helicase n=1 Tax=Apodospora peruviana TaxID=516989 RepID=A0AAE0I6C7_9PEZI|nr:P-loop containing nucleoside triphosphate hydrolase protein [Apodospora peruviana]